MSRSFSVFVLVSLDHVVSSVVCKQECYRTGISSQDTRSEFISKSTAPECTHCTVCYRQQFTYTYLYFQNEFWYQRKNSFGHWRGRGHRQGVRPTAFQEWIAGMLLFCFFYVAGLIKIFDFQAVTIADLSEAHGNQTVREITEQYGPNRAIFVKTDVTKADQLEGTSYRWCSHFLVLCTSSDIYAK